MDAVTGNDGNQGTVDLPFKTMERAVSHANMQTGQGSLTIKVLPGTYILRDKIVINPVRILSDSTRFTVEAAILPDDTDWTWEKMPVVLSVSDNNSTTQFAHATGFLVASPHVTLRGLKFLGNPNPSVAYYYPVSKENPQLPDLETSQCMFIGDKESSRIQGGIWAHGPNNTVTHCFFYETRNTVLFFTNVDGFRIDHTIVYGSYESAFWFGPKSPRFTFTNNVIANNENVIVGPSDLHYKSTLANSAILGNHGFIGQWSRKNQKVLPISQPEIKEAKNIRKGKVLLKENSGVMPTRDHSHIGSESDGKALGAGIFALRAGSDK